MSKLTFTVPMVPALPFRRRQKWTEEEDEFLRSEYPDHGQQWCADKLSRPKLGIRQRAYELGLRLNRDSEFYKEFQRRAAASKIGHPGHQKRGFKHKTPRSEEFRKHASETTRAWQQHHGHPRGALGMRHSEDMRAKMSIRVRRAWSDPNSKFNSAEHRQRKSDIMMRRAAVIPKENQYSRCKRGRRDGLGSSFFRSAWEANYARYLNWMKERGEIHQWEYEVDTFWFEAIKRGVRSYTPDFKILDSPSSDPRYVEVKGWMDPKSLTKLKRMKKYHPKVRIDVFGETEYKQLKTQMSRILEGWE